MHAEWLLALKPLNVQHTLQFYSWVLRQLQDSSTQGSKTWSSIVATYTQVWSLMITNHAGRQMLYCPPVGSERGYVLILQKMTAAKYKHVSIVTRVAGHVLNRVCFN